MKNINNFCDNLEILESKNPINYLEAISIMEKKVASVLKNETSELIWFLEHPSIYTSGRGSFINLSNINNIPVYNTGRGGKITWHGPGQRILYFVINLKKRNIDIRKFVYNLEEFIINSLEDLNILAYRKKGLVGIWTKNNQNIDAKISSLGLRVKRGIIYHGVSLNVKCDLSNFYKIEACGIKNPSVTSVNALIGINDCDKVDNILKKNINSIFAI